MNSQEKQIRQFGKFRLDVGKRVLWYEGEPVNLQMKEIELLCALTEQSGEVITKDELLEKVWGDSFVEESNLSRHIYLLRKTFKDYGESEDLIQTVPRRGYRFAGEVRELGNGELVIEKHSLTRTLIEEVGDATLPLPRPALTRSRLLVLVGVLIAVATSGVAFWRYNRTNASDAAGIKSIAVLPLKPLGDEEEDRTLGLGLTEALITRMGGFRSIRVRSVPTSSHYAKQEMDPRAIGEALGVDAVLEGSVQREDGRIRVTVRLFSVGDGKQIWSGNFDENEANIFNLQDAISAQVTQSLSLQLNQQERELLTRRYTQNVEAYHAYVRGRFFFDKRTEDYFKKAVKEFQQAINLDPVYVPAYSGLADAYALWANNSKGEQRAELYEKAKANALKAIELDETSAEAHTSLGWIKRIYDWDWPGSEREFKRAIELNPAYANAHQWYALLLVTLGRKDEALAEIKKARDLDPLSVIVMLNFSAVHKDRREYDEALQYAYKALELEDSYGPKRAIAQLYVLKGMYTEAIEFIETRLDKEEIEGGYVLTSLTTAYFLSGQQAKGEEHLSLLEERARNSPESAAHLISVYCYIGKKDEALTLLERLYEARDDRLVWIKAHAHFDPLRDDPRFKDLLRKMNLSE